MRESGLMRTRAAGTGSYLRYATDCLLSRGLALWDLPSKDSERTIRLEGGVEVQYRLNRGDIQTIREVWLEECYCPPVETPVDLVVDLGANIGLTSLWFAKCYGVHELLCVEPAARNIDLVRRNLTSNGVKATILQAAVGPEDGVALFADDPEANRGHLSNVGSEVPVISMETILSHLPLGRRVDLLKMDIEGSEQGLLTGDLAWLDRVDALIVEFHPSLVDHQRLIRVVEGQGFCYIPAGTVRWNSMDYFLRTYA
jgi:FkbM family methyltransferase